MRTIKCTNCSANLTIQDDNRDFAFCEYCGTKIMLDDYRSTHRVVDEAKIKQAEIDKEIKLKQLELIEQQQNNNKKSRKVKLIVSFIVFGIAIIIGAFNDEISSAILLALTVILFIWIFDSIETNNSINNMSMLSTDMVRVPDSVMGYKNMNYDMVAKMFENAGFHNIQLVPMGDLVLGVFNTPNVVDRILINNELVVQGGGTYSPGARVVIYYHSSKF